MSGDEWAPDRKRGEGEGRGNRLGIRGDRVEGGGGRLPSIKGLETACWLQRDTGEHWLPGVPGIRTLARAP